MRATLTILALVPTIGFAAASAPAAVATAPVRSDAGNATGVQTAVFAGGCFWGMEAVFERLRGVRSVEAGYTGGKAMTAHYEVVSTGLTGHAESILVRFDPQQISYRQLLDVYFGVAHDPTTKNRQGNDVGRQYRSEIFYASPDQRHAAEATIAKLDAAHAYPAPIVTELAPLGAFYPAERTISITPISTPTTPISATSTSRRSRRSRSNSRRSSGRRSPSTVSPLRTSLRARVAPRRTSGGCP